MNKTKILFIVSSCKEIPGTNRVTGVWLQAIADPYFIFLEAGMELTLSSPAGGPVSLEPKSEAIMVATRNTKRFLKDERAMDFLSRSVPVTDLNAADFDLVFLPGGYGSLWDFTGNKALDLLLTDFEHLHKPIAAVAHGVAGLLSVTSRDGGSFLKDRSLTGFSKSEDESGGSAASIPFMLESLLVSSGALYTKGPDLVSHVIVDRNLVTGQNPASAAEVARQVMLLVQTPLKKSRETLATNGNL